MTDLTNNQQIAIRGAINAGRDIAERYPEVAKYYVSGRPLHEIVDTLDLHQRYPQLTEPCLKNAVHYAIHGHSGGFDIYPYAGLIRDQSQLEQIALDHHRENGYRIAQERIGVHGLSTEERQTICSRAGEVGGLVNKINGTGLFGRSKEKIYEDRRNATRAKGYTPWKSDEVEYASQLAQDPAYAHGSKISNARIAKEVNIRYHGRKSIRNATAVKAAIKKHKAKSK